MSESQEVTNNHKGLSDFFAAHEGKASSKIYQNLATDPIILDLSKRKKFTYRETLILVSTVVGALDEKIETLEKQANNWSQIRSSFNAPLLISKADVEPEENKTNSDHIEANWFLKYLTLRNILGVLVIIITMSAGLFSFLNKDYRSLIQAEGAKAQKYAEELVEIKSKNEEISLQLKEIQIIKNNLESKLSAADEQIDGLERELDSSKNIVGKTQVESATQKADLSSQLAIEASKAKQFEGLYNKEILDRKKWEEIAKEKDRTLNQRSSEFKELERSHYSTKQDLDAMVNAWNQLLVYIGGKSKGRYSPTIEVKVSKINSHIDGVITSINQITGMRSKVPTE